MIPRRLSVMLGVVAFLGISSCASFGSDWTMGRGDAGQTGFTEEKLELPLSLSWQYNATKYKNNPSSPAAYNGKIYFCSGDRLYAVDAETGEFKWKYPAEGGLAGMVKTSVTVAEGLVFFGATDGNLYAIDAETGKYAWAFSTSGAIKSSPIVIDGIAFVGSDDNNLYAIDVQTGEGVPAWGSGFRTKDDVAFSPASSQGLVVFVSKDTNMYAANTTTGKTRWYTRLPMASSTCTPVISDGIIYVAVSNIVQIHTLMSGDLRSTIRLPAEAATAPAVAGRNIYIPCKDKKLYAFEYSGKTVKPKWSQGVELKVQAAAAPTIAGDLVIVPGAQGVVSAFSTTDGILKWRYTATPSKAGGYIDSTDTTASPIVANGALYVLTDDGALHCFRSDAADDTGPEISNIAPMLGSAMNGAPPIDISLNITDMGSGIDESSIQLSLDGEPREHEYDFGKALVKYQLPVTQPVRALRDGPHTIEISAKDWRGNKMEAKWSFLVDNTLRPRVIPKSASGQKAKTEPKKRPSMPRPNMPQPNMPQPNQPGVSPSAPPMPPPPGQGGAGMPPPPGPGPHRRPGGGNGVPGPPGPMQDAAPEPPY